MAACSWLGIKFPISYEGLCQGCAANGPRAANGPWTCLSRSGHVYWNDLSVFAVQFVKGALFTKGQRMQCAASGTRSNRDESSLFSTIPGPRISQEMSFLTSCLFRCLTLLAQLHFYGPGMCPKGVEYPFSHLVISFQGRLFHWKLCFLFEPGPGQVFRLGQSPEFPRAETPEAERWSGSAVSTKSKPQVGPAETPEGSVLTRRTCSIFREFLLVKTRLIPHGRRFMMPKAIYEHWNFSRVRVIGQSAWPFALFFPEGKRRKPFLLNSLTMLSQSPPTPPAQRITAKKGIYPALCYGFFFFNF